MSYFQLTSRLTHPNTVSIYDYGRTPEGVFYYAMEFLDGLDLQQLVETSGPQPASCVVRILEQVASALSEAHSLGLIHRDIKPANVILCERGGLPGIAKVVDFGLVKSVQNDGASASLSGIQAIVVTPLYLSPEQISAPENVDGRSDLYALGALAYFLLTGTPVFGGRTLVEICGHHLYSQPVAPSERCTHAIPREVDALVLELLAKEPAQRPGTARELLLRLQDGQPVDVTSPSCVDALARVIREDPSDPFSTITSVHFAPINIANEETSGIDVTANYRLQTASAGDFRFSGNYTWVRAHESQQYTGDLVEDQFAVNSGFDIPRNKASASVSWETGHWTTTLHGERLGRLPNSDSYAEVYDPEDGGSPWIGATYRYHATLQYRFNERAQLSLAVTNLFDKMPPRDVSSTGYPYYDISWFDAVGRQVYLQYTHKFGGGAR